MYFAVSWLEPRLVVNETAPEWTVEKTGPKDVSFTHFNIFSVKKILMELELKFV